MQSIKVSPADSYSKEIFQTPPGAKLRMAALDGPPGQERTLALIEVQPTPQRPVTPSSATVIAIADLDRAIVAARAIPGVAVFSERTLHTHDGRIGREVGLIDADGHALVLFNV